MVNLEPTQAEKILSQAMDEVLVGGATGGFRPDEVSWENVTTIMNELHKYRQYVKSLQAENAQLNSLLYLTPNSKVDLNYLDDEVLDSVAKALGMEIDYEAESTEAQLDALQDKLNSMSCEEVLSKYLQWHGLLGYSWTDNVLKAINSIKSATMEGADFNVFQVMVPCDVTVVEIDKTEVKL